MRVRRQYPHDYPSPNPELEYAVPGSWVSKLNLHAICYLELPIFLFCRFGYLSQLRPLQPLTHTLHPKGSHVSPPTFPLHKEFQTAVLWLSVVTYLRRD